MTSAQPFEIYRALRVVNPSPYLYFLNLDDASVVGSSPEMLVKVQGRNATYRPLAGTQPRGRNEKEDRELEAKLLADPKERAEHVMLVDLGRNDLGRVCEYGSVKPERLMFVERYSHVMHIASSLRGRLRDDVDCFDALMACFPAGTLSGAPKVRAMEIIDELEPTRRGIYAGAILYLDFSGNLDSCIGLRRRWSPKTGHAYVQAGAGIVADSVPGARIRGVREQGQRGAESPRNRPSGRRRSPGIRFRAILDNQSCSSCSTTTIRLLTTWRSISGRWAKQLEIRRNDQITLDEIEELQPERIVISPGPCTPAEAGISVPLIERFAGKIPILGVCLGHQAIGAAFGGRVIRAPHVMHGKTSEIHHDGKTIFRKLPQDFPATRYHSLIVERKSLPQERFEISAETADRHDHGIASPQAEG